MVWRPYRFACIRLAGIDPGHSLFASASEVDLLKVGNALDLGKRVAGNQVAPQGGNRQDLRKIISSLRHPSGELPRQFTSFRDGKNTRRSDGKCGVTVQTGREVD